MWYQIKSYFKFFLKSNNQHGIHSPFVYDLVTNCFYVKKNYTEYAEIKKIRNQIFQNTNEIDITDFGAGSRVFKSNKRKVSDIAKNAGITFKRQKLLFRLIRYFNPENILELGTSLGLGTSAMAFSNPSNKIKTVEGCPNTSKVAQSFFDEFNLKNINLHSETFEEFFNKNPSDIYDLIYVDGNHKKENTLQYFKILLERINNNSVIIFDDIYWSSAMTEAWQEIIRHPKVTVSIDTFYWGFVFFRKEQEKEHFTIRL
ncbi:MAG: class I SAM-dependent methyltransferase [Flavobacteriaceae bacterium]|nr:class I SAM-dependent methyltransferase [Flavobacteriaceae bacterium]